MNLDEIEEYELGMSPEESNAGDEFYFADDWPDTFTSLTGADLAVFENDAWQSWVGNKP